VPGVFLIGGNGPDFYLEPIAPTATVSPTASPSPTPTESPTPSPTISSTPTPSVTPSQTPYDGQPFGDFNNDGCTDLTDFLTVIDFWQNGYGLDDFLHVLDNWQQGVSCG
jgi:hypothetical protein